MTAAHRTTSLAVRGLQNADPRNANSFTPSERHLPLAFSHASDLRDIQSSISDSD